ncbi:cytochrome c oxidase subunit I [Pseudomonas sp. G11-1]|uniref:cytochrome-c oxidase n=1 Tax=Halopseudomonas bauzanensis TaxID=653930 RepID=A0A1H9VX68_9GAMM|nr:cytochrome c oxidase subunit I [Halopseudomonas bauzanensis]MCO5787172.1 cytochrome c oxidase subunit I [Pseudomonas sp. G11-1]MCO5790398.1 cytochrome c oxidase subunit I [Pseudomonas sp. G11-2]SES26390.1 cytochrome c oxidase subunit I+III [Halopseudomonas bauzanensis]SFM23983.1 cytochrome c oxidase subunit I+III [Halopseudomonas bauzanensis]
MSEQQKHSAQLHEQFDRVWGNLPGFGQLAAVNHTSVGLRFVVTGLFFFLVGGVLAMLMRTQLALPEQEIIGPELYSQLFTMHGTLMMFLFAIPILEGVAMYLIPKMVGARDLAFPRLGAMGYYCYLFGGLIILSSLALSIAPDSGWFMYTPLSSSTFSPGPGSDFWLLGITFVEISSMTGAIELVISILRTRSNGMSLRRMPIFCWYILAMALMIVFGFPPLILGSILLELERAAGLVFFEVAGGGDPLLWQHLFWLFGHPEVYIIFLPAAGIVSTLIPVFARRPIVGYRWIVLAVIVMGFISFGLWVHHMFTVGIPQLAQAFFSMASMLVAIPTAIQVFAWLATLWTGRVVWNLPMLWILGFLIIFVAGGLTGVMLALVPFNWQVHDTHFVVAHMHYVLVGGMLFPLIAGLYYWLPHVSGRMPSDMLGRWAFWLVFIGFNMTFLLMHLTGLLGMPRRVYTYEAGLGWDWLNLLSSIGGFVMAIGIAMFLLDIFLHFRFGRRAPRNPWGADSLEWAVAMPVTTYNFISLPDIRSRHPLWHNPQLPFEIEEGKHAMAVIRHGRRETWGSDAVTGRVREVVHLPSHSWIPLQAGVVLAIVCLSLLLKTYWLALGATLVAAFIMLRWSWVNGAHPDMAPVRDDDPSDPPLHSRTHDGPGRWGMLVTLMANGSFYASLLFGWFYLWTASPQWQAPEQGPLALMPLLASGVLLSLAVVVYQWLTQRLRRGVTRHLQGGLWISAGIGLIHVAVLVWLMLAAELTPTQSAHDSVLAVMLGYLLFHGALSAVATAMQAVRVRFGYVSAQLPYEPLVLQPFWSYTLGVFWLSFAAFILLPMAW